MFYLFLSVQYILYFLSRETSNFCVRIEAILLFRGGRGAEGKLLLINCPAIVLIHGSFVTLIMEIDGIYTKIFIIIIQQLR